MQTRSSSIRLVGDTFRDVMEVVRDHGGGRYEAVLNRRSSADEDMVAWYGGVDTLERLYDVVFEVATCRREESTGRGSLVVRFEGSCYT